MLPVLARVALTQEDMLEAERYADQALEWIRVNGSDGIEYPLRVLLSCAQVYAASNHMEQETLSIQLATDLLNKRATRISDQVARQSYLNNVPIHKEITQYLTVAS